MVGYQLCKRQGSVLSKRFKAVSPATFSTWPPIVFSLPCTAVERRGEDLGGDFTTLTRQITVEEPLAEASDIYRLGCFLLGRQKLVSRPLRLLGLGVSNLREPKLKQLALF